MTAIPPKPAPTEPGILAPLRDDARLYAARLAAAGDDVWFREEPQMIHAWLRASHMSEGARTGFAVLCQAVAHLARRPAP